MYHTKLPRTAVINWTKYKKSNCRRYWRAIKSRQKWERMWPLKGGNMLSEIYVFQGLSPQFTQCTVDRTKQKTSCVGLKNWGRNRRLSEWLDVEEDPGKEGITVEGHPSCTSKLPSNPWLSPELCTCRKDSKESRGRWGREEGGGRRGEGGGGGNNCWEAEEAACYGGAGVALESNTKVNTLGSPPKL